MHFKSYILKEMKVECDKGFLLDPVLRAGAYNPWKDPHFEVTRKFLPRTTPFVAMYFEHYDGRTHPLAPVVLEFIRRIRAMREAVIDRDFEYRAKHHRYFAARNRRLDYIKIKEAIALVERVARGEATFLEAMEIC